jgi:hypothetical protein
MKNKSVKASSILRLACWNIDGLYQRIDGQRLCKLQYPEFQQEVLDIDILGLVETHVGSKGSLILPGYKIFLNHRPKAKKSPKHFGGLAFCIKDSLCKGVTVVDRNGSEIMWLKLHKSFFHLEDDIYIGLVYANPQYSSFTHQTEDVFALVSQDLAKYSNMGKCIILRDFNARTKTSADYIEHDSHKFDYLTPDYINDTPMYRRNMDLHVIDNYGNKLLDLCKSTGVRILNGRTLGDLLGNVTCYSPNGAPSCIDYMCASTSLFKDIFTFNVDSLTPLSIHCKISASLHIPCNKLFYTEPESRMSPLPEHFKWEHKDSNAFKLILLSNENQNSIDLFLEKNFTGTPQDTNEAVATINNILTDAANKANIKIYKKRTNTTKKKVS